MPVSYLITKSQELDGDAVDALNPFKSGKHNVLADSNLKDGIVEELNKIRKNFTSTRPAAA